MVCRLLVWHHIYVYSYCQYFNKYYTRNDEEVKNVLLEGSLYLQSTLEAYNLFIKYYNGSLSLKKEILQSIQKLFEQEYTLEDMLSSFDVSLESSIDPIRLNKYIKRWYYDWKTNRKGYRNN